MNMIDELMTQHPVLESCKEDIQSAFDMLKACYEQDGIVYICGNGGSAADAEHIVGELMKSFCLHRPPPEEFVKAVGDPYIHENLEHSLRAVSLCGHVSLSTAFANDVAPDLVFAQQVYGWSRPGDVLWGISTSGNSKNVMYALKVARAKGVASLGMTGQGGGAMAEVCDVCIRVPEAETYKVQELHLPVYHTLCLMLEQHFFGSPE